MNKKYYFYYFCLLYFCDELFDSESDKRKKEK